MVQIVLYCRPTNAGPSSQHHISTFHFFLNTFTINLFLQFNLFNTKIEDYLSHFYCKFVKSNKQELRSAYSDTVTNPLSNKPHNW